MSKCQKDKLYSIGKGWNSEAALRDVLAEVKHNPESQVIIVFSEHPDGELSYRCANVTNAQANYLMDSFKNRLLNRCFVCKCEQGDLS